MKHLPEFVARVATMTDEQRAALASSMPIITCEGHPLSVRNNVLCAMQCAAPVTVVGGFRQWLAHGRCVRKGERAIYILRPCERKAEEDGGEASRFFLEVAVFDISQTDALPEGASAKPIAQTAKPVSSPARAPQGSDYYSEQFIRL